MTEQHSSLVRIMTMVGRIVAVSMTNATGFMMINDQKDTSNGESNIGSNDIYKAMVLLSIAINVELCIKFYYLHLFSVCFSTACL